MSSILRGAAVVLVLLASLASDDHRLRGQDGQNCPPLRSLWAGNRSAGSWGTETLRDIEVRLPRGHQYSAESLVTWAHEGTHGVNASLRARSGDPNAFYLPPDCYVSFPSPAGLTLAAVARAVPQRDRGDIYQLYLVDQQRWWNDTPLYVFDEWVSYRNGAMVAIELAELRQLRDQAWSEVQSACEMGVYACHCVSLITESYPARTRLRMFLWWLVNDSLLLEQTARELGELVWRPSVGEWATKLKTQYEVT